MVTTRRKAASSSTSRRQQMRKTKFSPYHTYLQNATARGTGDYRAAGIFPKYFSTRASGDYRRASGDYRRAYGDYRTMGRGGFSDRREYGGTLIAPNWLRNSLKRDRNQTFAWAQRMRAKRGSGIFDFLKNKAKELLKTKGKELLNNLKDKAMSKGPEYFAKVVDAAKSKDKKAFAKSLAKNIAADIGDVVLTTAGESRGSGFLDIVTKVFPIAKTILGALTGRGGAFYPRDPCEQITHQYLTSLKARGGFFGALLGALAPAVVSGIGSLLKGRGGAAAPKENCFKLIKRYRDKMESHPHEITEPFMRFAT